MNLTISCACALHIIVQCTKLRGWGPEARRWGPEPAAPGGAEDGVLRRQPLTFKHADGTQYGGALLGGAADRNAQVFAALRGMGFKERECRTALERCTAMIAPNATREEMLRTALHVLTI
ncbi:MAG: RuvA C-terminal domain-containing protein [Myxococcota bacterium]